MAGYRMNFTFTFIRLGLLMEIIVLFSEHFAEHKYTVWVKYKVLNATSGGTYTDHCALNG
jgi:hypothetical protein